MNEPNPELEPNAPDWSNEPASDDLLTEQLQERGMSMGEVQDPNVPAPETSEVPPPPETPGAPDTAPDSPAVPAPDTSPPEEQEGETGNNDEEDGA